MIFGRFLDFGPKQPAVMSSSPSSARVDRSNAEEEDARRVRESLKRINNCIRPNQGSEYRSKKLRSEAKNFFFCEANNFSIMRKIAKLQNVLDILIILNFYPFLHDFLEFLDFSVKISNFYTNCLAYRRAILI